MQVADLESSLVFCIQPLPVWLPQILVGCKAATFRRTHLHLIPDTRT